MGWFSKPTKEMVNKTLESVERDDSILELEKLERQMQDFLNTPPDTLPSDEGPEALRKFEAARLFEPTKLKVKSQEEQLRKNLEKATRIREAHFRENRRGHDPIALWEEENQDYNLKRIDLEKVDVDNYARKDISLEFVDFLLDNFYKQNNYEQLSEIAKNIKEIHVMKITEDNKYVVLAVSDEANNKAVLSFYAPDFRLKTAVTKDRRFTF